MNELIICQKQAQEISKTIFADIEDYVNEHLDEYNEFLKSESGKLLDTAIEKVS